MPPSPRSHRFALATLAGTGTTTIYTVPASKVAFVRLLTLINVNALSRTATVGINGSADTNNVHGFTVTRAAPVTLETRMVLTAGETLDVTASAVNSVYVSAFGFLFDA